MVSSVIDLLLSTLFNIEAATVVTLLVEVTLLFFQCMWIFYGYNCETNLLKLIVSL